MSARPSVIETARAAVAATISLLGVVPPECVVEHRAGNVASKFQEQMVKTGLGVIVGIASAHEKQGQSTRVYWSPIQIFVAVAESSMHQLQEDYLPGAWAIAEEIVAGLKLAAVGDGSFPQISNEPLREIESDQEGSLVVRFTLDLYIDGNSRS
jgi:hypothetical protein